MSISINFELMPDEKLIECFQFFNEPDLFYSLDQLNDRLSNLIWNILLLYLNFQQFKKLLFNHFCQIMLLNPQVKQNIVCLQLSDESTNGQVESFLSLFSLNQFTHLRSLKLIGLNDRHVQQILTMLPFLFNLHSFSFTSQEFGNLKIIDALSKSNIRILTISEFTFISKVIYKRMSFIISLTMNNCVIEDLLELFQYTLILKYLKVHYFRGNDIEDYVIDTNIISLKQFIINDSQIKKL